MTLKRARSSLTSLMGLLLMLIVIGSMASFAQGSTNLENSLVATGDFSMSTLQTSLTIQQSTPITSQTVICEITVTSQSGFSGRVSFSIDAPTGFTTGINPTSVNLEAGGSAPSSLSLSSTVAGTFKVILTGISGALAHSITFSVTVTVPPPDFTITASPDSLNLAAGSSGNSTLTFTSLFGFSGTVTLSSSAYNTVSPWPSPYNVTASLSSTSVSLSPNSTAKSTVMVGTANTTPTGHYEVYINGVSGNLTRQAFVDVGVGPFFTMNINPRSISIPTGTSGNFTITLTSFASFTIYANLQPQVNLPGPLLPCEPVCPAQSYPNVSVSPTTITLAPFGTAEATLTVSTNSSTTPGNYNIAVFGGGCVCLLPTDVVAANVTRQMSLPDPLAVFSGPFALLIIGGSTVLVTFAASLLYARRRHSL